MGEVARVDSIDAIRAFRPVIFKFQEAAGVALGDAESEMQRELTKLETELPTFWQGQIRKRQEAVTRAQEAVRMKKIFKDATGRQQSAVEEEKVLQQAMRKLQEAQQKLMSVKQWTRRLQKEIEMYKGSVQRFATSVQSELPAAAAYLENITGKLDAYVAVGPAGYGGGGAPVAPQQASMARAVSGLPAGSPQELAALRQQVPNPAQRSGAALAEQANLAIAPIPPDQRSAIARWADEKPSHGESKVFITSSTASGKRLFFHRVEPTSPDDTGWSIFAADGSDPGEWSAIRLENLLRARADFAELMALPLGFSAIIDESGIDSVIDPAGQSVWRRS